VEVILASASPRRRDILSSLGVTFRVRPANVDETVDTHLPPWEICTLLSKRKADSVVSEVGGSFLVIASDTIVWKNGRVFGKPSDRNEAHAMLSELSGSVHSVYSGVALCLDGKCAVGYDHADVTFKKLTPREIGYYIDNYPPYDKAGAYGIQDFASLFAEKISGDYLSIIGFPLFRASELLKDNFGMDFIDLTENRR